MVVVNLTRKAYSDFVDFEGKQVFVAQPEGDLGSLAGLEVVLLVDDPCSIDEAVVLADQISGVAALSILDLQAQLAMPISVGGVTVDALEIAKSPPAAWRGGL